MPFLGVRQMVRDRVQVRPGALGLGFWVLGDRNSMTLLLPLGYRTNPSALALASSPSPSPMP